MEDLEKLSSVNNNKGSKIQTIRREMMNAKKEVKAIEKDYETVL